MADVPLPLGSRTVPVPQLPASNCNSSHGLNRSDRSNPLTHSLTHQPSRSTPLYLTKLYTCPGHNASAGTAQETPILGVPSFLRAGRYLGTAPLLLRIYEADA
jgi:hypothetical protein